MRDTIVSDIVTIWERLIWHTKVRRVEAVVGNGKIVRYTVLEIPATANCHLEYDPLFTTQGFKAGAGGWLIDQEATKQKWGRPPGRLPEWFLDGYQEGTIACCPSNWGWQNGLVLIDNGKVLVPTNDTNPVTGNSILAHCQGRWITTRLELQQPTDIDCGIDLPPIVKEGEIVPLAEVISHPRFLADPRNAFDFSAGKAGTVGSDFWRLIRDLLPDTAEDIRKLARGEEVLVVRDGLCADDLNTLRRIAEESGIEGCLHFSMRHGVARMAVREKLPLNRIPVFGLGHNERGNLVVIGVDGRQKSSAGVTITELAALMVNEKVTNGGVGSAGGDVVIAVKDDTGATYLNTPYAGRSRPVPSTLIVVP